jgi:2-oxoglutarate dehydrogenase E2 component (dihydrolipoamide succinyltransferase)
MAVVELIMPKMGESITEATILKWLKKEGDRVSLDEPILEIATDKVDSEVPSPFAGTISKILFNINDIVQVGKAIALIETEAGTATRPSPATLVTQPQSVPTQVIQPPVTKNIIQTNQAVSNGSRFYSPLVLNIAREEGIGLAELENIPGTGAENRVTKKDILNYISNRNAAPVQSVNTAVAPVAQAIESSPVISAQNNPAVSYSGNVEIIEMDRMRRLIADHMVRSKHTSPHVTSFVETDVTNMVLWREKVKKMFEKREGEKITFTPLFIEAIVKAIKDFPMVNASVDGYNIIRKKDINIGMAAATPSGNLIVPVKMPT